MAPLKTNDTSWCVYIHISPSQKYYVGITSQTPNHRWRNGKGYKECTAFYNAIQKYGWDAIYHEIVASNLTELEAKNYEILLISKLKSNDKNYGYNISAGGDGTTGVSYYGKDNGFYNKHHSEKNKAVTGANTKKSWSSGLYDDILCRPIYQFDMNGDFVKSYKSLREAEEITGISHSVICRVCQRKLNYTHGFTWVYQDECKDLKLFKENFLGRMKCKSENHARHLRKPVVLYDLHRNYINTFDSATQLAQYLGVHKDTIACACRKNTIVQGKYLCVYKEGGKL